MRTGSFTIENLFDWAVGLNQDQWVDRPGSDPSRFTGGRATLELHGKLNGLLANPIHARADKDVILDCLRQPDLGSCPD